MARLVDVTGDSESLEGAAEGESSWSYRGGSTLNAESAAGSAGSLEGPLEGPLEGAAEGPLEGTADPVRAGGTRSVIASAAS
jgi:hypothetical protein